MASQPGNFGAFVEASKSLGLASSDVLIAIIASEISAARNLPLAAGPVVGHIRHNGAVAEWLKAAVC